MTEESDIPMTYDQESIYAFYQKYKSQLIKLSITEKGIQIIDWKKPFLSQAEDDFCSIERLQMYYGKAYKPATFIAILYHFSVRIPTCTRMFDVLFHWNDIISQWKTIDKYDDFTDHCICSHVIHQSYTVRNNLNRNKLTIGIDCINKFCSLDLKKQAKELKDAHTQQTIECILCGREFDKIGKISTCLRCLARYNLPVFTHDFKNYEDSDLIYDEAFIKFVLTPLIRIIFNTCNLEVSDTYETENEIKLLLEILRYMVDSDIDYVDNMKISEIIRKLEEDLKYVCFAKKHYMKFNVPYAEKDVAKKFGLLFHADDEEKYWYAPRGLLTPYQLLHLKKYFWP